MTSLSLFPFHSFTPVIRVRKPGFFLFGHGIIEKPKVNRVIQDLHLPLHQFRAMISLWQEMGFAFLSMEEALEVVLHNRTMKKPWIHLTFDDGYENNYSVLYPFLKARRIPFTIFLSTRNIMEQKRFDNYRIYCALIHTNDEQRRRELIEEFNLQSAENISLDSQASAVVQRYKYFSAAEKERFLPKVSRLLTDEEWKYYDEVYGSEAVMTPDDVHAMSRDPLVTFGSHGHNHYILSTLDDTAINFEQRESKRLMKHLTGKDPLTYCYPNGKPKDIPENISTLTRSNKYQAAFTTVKSKCTGTEDPFAIPRFPLSYTYMPKLFLKIV